MNSPNHRRGAGFDFGQSTVESTVAGLPRRVPLGRGMYRSLCVDEVAGKVDIAILRRQLRRSGEGEVTVRIAWGPRGARVGRHLIDRDHHSPMPCRPAEGAVVVAVPFHAGGVRRFFACPACERYCRQLYAPLRGDPFLCRLCHALTYASCQATRADRDRTPKPWKGPDVDDPEEFW